MHIRNLFCFQTFQGSESVLERNQAQLQQRSDNNYANSGELELEVMEDILNQHEQEGTQNQGSQLPEILVNEFGGNKRDATQQEASEEVKTSNAEGHATAGKAAPSGISYKGLQRNSEPSHSFIRTFSNFYRRNN